MKKLFGYVKSHKLRFAIGVSGILAVVGLLFFRIGSLTSGLSLKELETLNTPIGIEALLNDPLYLPLDFVRSVLFFFVSDFGGLIGRIPNALFGLLAIVSFAYVIWRWHGRRTAFFGTVLFATSAWVLHVSRFASYDVLFLCAVPVLLATGILLQKYDKKILVFYLALVTWLTLLYIPGMVWLVALTLYWQKEEVIDGFKRYKLWWQRCVSTALVLLALPLLTLHLLKSSQFMFWIGMPDQWNAPLTVAKQFGAVGAHIFVRGPNMPDIWLVRAPILDIFTLVMAILGIYFYARHIKAYRTKMLFSYAVVAWLLVGLNGAVSLSLLVPLMYVFAAAGIAYLLREWLQVFPLNPFARGAGIALISVAVLLSCLYNVRAYFVAWPHNQATKTLFRYDR